MRAQIIHNPTAGEKNHHRIDLENFVRQGIFSQVFYTSMESEDWEEFGKNKPGVIFVAGGDGTVHKVAQVLLNKKELDPRTPIHILPLGTANNISKTLRIPPYRQHIFHSVKQILDFDLGKVTGLNDQDVFFESAGVGIFPSLIQQMDQQPVTAQSAAEELEYTLNRLLDLVVIYEPPRATITTEQESISGSFLLAEVMNIGFIGPNFPLAPQADPGDGYFNLVLIKDDKREQLKKYLEKMISNTADRKDLEEILDTTPVKKAKIEWDGSHVHVDDNVIPGFSGGSFRVTINPDRMRFVTHPEMRNK